MNKPATHYVLVALSEGQARHLLEVGAQLERFGYQVGTASSATETLGACGHSHYDVVVFDLELVRDVGLETWLAKLRLISPQTLPVALGRVDQLEVLRSLLQETGGDYLLLPLHPLELRTRIRRVLDLRRLGDAEAPAGTARRSELGQLVGGSTAMEAIRERIRKIAGLSSTVLITGESGVGKELIARAIHRLSPRRERPFIALNCSALPESLLESELFGHEKGAFTGAAALTRGKFELAHQGTLFLDEIGDMDPFTQAKILRVLEEREFMRVGGARYIRVDVRLVAATNANLEERMATGRFREDLYYRLKVLTIEVPPLRERRADVPELVRSFIDGFCQGNGIPPKRVTDEALEALARYRWPGNVRELRNTLENLIVSAPGAVIAREDLPAYILGARTDRPADGAEARSAEGPDRPSREGSSGGEARSLQELERAEIGRTLAEVRGNRTRAARLLKIGVRTLQRKIKKYGLEETA